MSRTRQHSSPPCVEHTPEDTIILPNGLECQTRCALRQAIYEALQINEDRNHTLALAARARQLPDLKAPMNQGVGEPMRVEPMKVEICDGWSCVCGARSPEKGVFCWKCGASRAFARPSDVPLRISSPLTRGGQSGQSPSKVEFHGQVKTKRGKIQGKLGNVISKYAPTLEALAEAISNKGSHSEGSDDRDVSTCEGPSNSGSESTDGGQQEITTIMICSLPFRVTNTQLIDAINSLGFNGSYDFVYMPSRSSKSRSSKAKAEKSLRRGNVGYAFVNFRSADHASRFSDTFQNFQFQGVPSEKEVLVKPAVCQGYEANVNLHYNKLNPGSMLTFDKDGEKCELLCSMD